LSDGLLSRHDVERIRGVFAAAHLPIRAPGLGVDRYLELMGHDKKIQSGRLRLILLRSLGEAVLTAEFSHDALQDVLGTCTGDG